MSVLLITVFCIVCALLAMFLKQIKPEYSLMISIVAVCAVTGLILTKLSVILDFIRDVFEVTGINNEYVKILFKSTGICYISHLGSTICKDCEQHALSQQIEAAAKFVIVLISLPVFSELLKIAASLSSA